VVPRGALFSWAINKKLYLERKKKPKKKPKKTQKTETQKTSSVFMGKAVRGEM